MGQFDTRPAAVRPAVVELEQGLMPDLRDRIAAVVRALPDGSSVTLPVAELRAWLASDPAMTVAEPAAAAGWRERLWTCPPDTRLGVRELCEALARSPDFVYRQVSPRSRRRLPHRRMAGELVFVAAEVRQWIAEAEDVIAGRPGRLRVSR